MSRHIKGLKHGPREERQINHGPAMLRFSTELREIKDGRRGWLSITRWAKEIGTSKAALQAIAESYGLQCANHGKFGLCASRRD
jgi:hypothetical protein